MAAPAIDRSKPVFGSTAVDDDLDQLRDNITWLLIAASQGPAVMPGWATTTAYTGNQLDSLTLTENGSGAKIRVEYTWTGGVVTQQVWSYDKNLGAGWETLSAGTITLTYDGNGNFTGATSA